MKIVELITDRAVRERIVNWEEAAIVLMPSTVKPFLNPAISASDTSKFEQAVTTLRRKDPEVLHRLVAPARLGEGDGQVVVDVLRVVVFRAEVERLPPLGDRRLVPALPRQVQGEVEQPVELGRRGVDRLRPILLERRMRQLRGHMCHARDRGAGGCQGVPGGRLARDGDHRRLR